MFLVGCRRVFKRNNVKARDSRIKPAARRLITAKRRDGIYLH